VKSVVIPSAIVVLSLAPAAFAADRKVPSADYPTIAAAVAAAQPNDRILVGPGVYRENVVSNVPGLQFVGRKAVWDGTTGPGASGSCLVSTGDAVLVQGFTFVNGKGVQIRLTGESCRVVKCASRNARGVVRIDGANGEVVSLRAVGSQSGGTGSVTIVGDGALVDRCTFRNCDSVAVRIAGNLATLQRTSAVQIEDDAGFDLQGDDAKVLKCVVSNVDSEGVRITGERATVSGNRFEHLSTDGVRVTGDQATIEANQILGAGMSGGDAKGIVVTGDLARVSRNRVSETNGHGIDVTGDKAGVDGNDVAYTGGHSIFVSGDSFEVRGNRVRVTVDDADGIRVVSTAANPSSVVEDNVAEDVIQYGFWIQATNTTVRRNRAVRCGTETEGGFLAAVQGGSGMVFEDDVAIDCGSDGFQIYHASVRLLRCVATDCAADGFDLGGYADILLDGCRAERCGGEGLDNAGTNTIVRKSRFARNRIDVASDGTFADFAADNVFQTGGTSTLPEVD
jgi:hypothetical protein